MEMSNFRPESHVAQQSRRDKLRVQQGLHFQDYTNNIEHISVHPVLSPDLMQVRNVRNSANSLYDPAVITSQTLNYSENSNVLFPHKNQESGAVELDRPMAAVDASLANLSHPISSHFNTKATRNNAQHCGIWRSIGSQQHYDWNSNHASGSAAGNESNPNRLIVDEVPSTIYLKQSNGYQDVQSSLTNHASSELSSDQESQRHYEEMHVGSSSQLYHNSLQEVVTSAAILQDSIGETARRSWTDGGNELVLLPQFGNQYNAAIGLNNASAWMNRPTEGSHQWNCESVSTQGLSLSLSSKPPLAETRVDQFMERYGDEASHVPQDLKPTIASKGYGNSLQDIVGTSTTAHRHTGPLGPFTGYATILKNSRFLRPAQLLLDEICRSEIVSGEVSGAKDGNSALSSSTFHSANEISEVGVGSSSSEPHRPEYHQKKAKLLCMHEEVCRRYKQYHQQMQMVVSSFETVAGLSASTPYISFALKTVARHFRHLKNAISNQLGDIRKSLGEDLSSPTTGTSCSKGDISTSKLKYVEQGFQKHKYGGGNMGFIDPQQHVWRPQRGLPERAVSILRAWLFEHFLHPYPTDTDKHMLANQTGLTRNQVSNWFINARVRVWKPMVEEIHMLETKGSAETELNSGKNDGTTATEGTNRTSCDQYFNKFSINGSRDKQLECSDIGSSLGTGDAMGTDQWNQEKRSRVEGHNPAGMDGSLMGFVPYHRNGLETGGLGSVSLTLGLRQSAESAQQQQLRQQEHQLRQHFGGHILHDFVG